MSRLEIQSRKFPQKSNFSKNTCEYPIWNTWNWTWFLYYLFSFLCCVFVYCLSSICVLCVPNVASVSWLHILDRPFGFSQTFIHYLPVWSGRHGHDRMVVGFTTTWAITTKVVISNPVHGKVYLIQHYVIKFISDLRQVCGFLRVLQFPSSIKLTATILLKYCWKWR